MKVSYERSMDHACLNIEVSEYKKTFEEEMLKNQIDGILPVQKECRDDSIAFSYDITNKQSFTEYIKQNPFDKSLVSKITRIIIQNLKAAKEYLLTSDNFVMKQEYIYVGDDGDTFWLCYLPGYHHDIKTQFMELFEEWMKIIDYADRITVQLVYELYHVSRQSTCTYDQLLEVMKRLELSPVEVRKPEKESAWWKQEEMTQSAITEEPSMNESLVDEKEILYYPMICYVKGAMIGVTEILIFFLLLKFGILSDTYHNLDYLKVFCMIVVLGVSLVFLLKSIFRKNQKLSRMIRDVHQEKAEDLVMEPFVQMQQNDSFTYDNLRTSNEIAPTNRKESQVIQEEFSQEVLPTQLLYEEEATKLLYHSTKLRLLPKTEIGEPIEFKSEEAVLGSRKGQVDIYLSYPTISRTHAKIIFEGEEFFVEDLSSTNGTFLNHRRLEKGKREVLKNGEILQFAEYAYEVSISELL